MIICSIEEIECQQLGSQWLLSNPKSVVRWHMKVFLFDFNEHSDKPSITFISLDRPGGLMK
jgi:hypothetical protein